ncbi:hypothetical protein TRVL_07043 [Trypanosoma vivax]|nr:hypothetical protein TRVL_07043 [Trypanosoma vivax]
MSVNMCGTRISVSPRYHMQRFRARSNGRSNTAPSSPILLVTSLGNVCASAPYPGNATLSLCLSDLFNVSFIVPHSAAPLNCLSIRRWAIPSRFAKKKKSTSRKSTASTRPVLN